MESEEYNPENLDLRFDVESVLNELKRGKRLVKQFLSESTLSAVSKHSRGGGCTLRLSGQLCLGRRNERRPWLS